MGDIVWKFMLICLRILRVPKTWIQWVHCLCSCPQRPRSFLFHQTRRTGVEQCCKMRSGVPLFVHSEGCASRIASIVFVSIMRDYKRTCTYIVGWIVFLCSLLIISDYSGAFPYGAVFLLAYKSNLRLFWRHSLPPCCGTFINQRYNNFSASDSKVVMGFQ